MALSESRKLAGYGEQASELFSRVADRTEKAIAELPGPAQKKLSEKEAELVEGIRQLIAELSRGIDTPARLIVAPPDEIEDGEGVGLGALVSRRTGIATVRKLARDVPLEDWAGPLAGPTELERSLGIPRSTLDHWQKNGVVVGFLKGAKRHTYPTKQFVDGRPARGLPEVVSIAGSAKVAWLWLNQANTMLDGLEPIEMLRDDQVDAVLDVARSYFGSP